MVGLFFSLSFSYAVLPGVRVIHLYVTMLTMLAGGSMVAWRTDTSTSVRVTETAIVANGTVL